jgi:hypothetical protein
MMPSAAAGITMTNNMSKVTDVMTIVRVFMLHLRQK